MFGNHRTLFVLGSVAYGIAHRRWRWKVAFPVDGIRPIDSDSSNFLNERRAMSYANLSARLKQRSNVRHGAPIGFGAATRHHPRSMKCFKISTNLSFNGLISLPGRLDVSFPKSIRSSRAFGFCFIRWSSGRIRGAVLFPFPTLFSSFLLRARPTSLHTYSCRSTCENELVDAAFFGSVVRPASSAASTWWQTRPSCPIFQSR